MLLHGGIKGVHVDVDDLALWPWGMAINHWFASWQVGEMGYWNGGILGKRRVFPPHHSITPLFHALSTRYFF
jgi:hypothetical protein